MKIVRFQAADRSRYGVLDGTHIVEYSGTPLRHVRKGASGGREAGGAPDTGRPTKIVALAPQLPGACRRDASGRSADR